ncbi:gamma-secretase subunit PEN-2 isoform X1 [Diaphorina citri]|uniref:Gamma-secretase subunit PEN-2 n=1 Tax=Diaphorina citri TaxID=121845 RepID=A0A1S3D5C1_DIACI|nr:gamma-secretase subunit PEN-2 isoform X1 [Diaphorina citri]KAI5697714.1 hypothetical protein M8J75_014543 [Diaphorina citri]KAI5718781.1 hypothetical protein M8J76_000336 [Diaphorina citri]KAI5721824.1 hypothetical protein M8J77_026181 [Diaphorina citri]
MSEDNTLSRVADGSPVHILQSTNAPCPAQPKRANPMKTLQVCRYYFLGGFFFLPCLWLVNVVWFFPEAFGHADLVSVEPEPTDESEGERRTRIRSAARRYVIISALGAAVWAIVLGTWVYVYQTRRSQWGEFGDAVSAIIPRGKP